VIEDFAAIEAAAVSPEFTERVLNRHRREAQLLLATAAQEWIDGGCVRYDDHEDSCTAGLAGRLLRLLEEGRRTALQLLAILENGGWTGEHFEGRANPATVPRPDVVLYLGVHHDVKMTVECKRLLRGSATARDYVKHGLCRFLTGRYSSDNGQATMIGFLLDQHAETARDDINEEIVQLLDAHQQLEGAEPLAGLTTVYRSTHPRASTGIYAVHLLLDIQDRNPAHSETS
jgi:hypothetical protein